MIKIMPTSLDGVLIIEPDIFKDSRGAFMETYQKKKYTLAGINSVFVQDNFSISHKGTLRGLHYQISHSQAKLVQVIKGAVFDVAIDLRSGSPTFGQWTGVELSDTNNRQMFIPEGFAHGFQVLTETAYFLYKCSDYYSKEDEGGIIWSDPEINIKWPAIQPLLSDKDAAYPYLKDISTTLLPKISCI